MTNKLSQNDLIQIADLHYSSLDNGFLALLGKKFLILIYSHIYKSKNSVIYIYRLDGKIIGFITGGLGLKEVYLSLMKNPIKLLYVLSWNLFKLDNVVKILLLIMRKHNVQSNEFKSIDAELYSIVVHKDYWGKGVAKILYKKLSNYFLHEGLVAFIIVVGNKLERAKNFYLQQGAHPIGILTQGRGKNSIIFKQLLKNL